MAIYLAGEIFIVQSKIEIYMYCTCGGNDYISLGNVFVFLYKLCIAQVEMLVCVQCKTHMFTAEPLLYRRIANTNTNTNTSSSSSCYCSAC